MKACFSTPSILAGLLGLFVSACGPSSWEQEAPDRRELAQGAQGGGLGSRMGSAVATGNTCGLSSDNQPACVFGPSAPDMVYSWTAPASDRYTFTTAGSTFDTVLELRSAAQPSLSLACNDDDVENASQQATLDVNLSSGQQVLIAIDSYGSACGQFSLGISAMCGGCDAPPGSCRVPAGTCVGGVCTYTLLPAGAVCDDGNACTSGDVCDGSGSCTGTPGGCQPDTCTGRVPAEDSVEAAGMLAFLNSASATLAVLDNEVALDSRAAWGLVSRRAGPDGVSGTVDDRPFRSLAEVDAVGYVNAEAIALLTDYARATWWIPLADGDCLGTFDTVYFTAGNARRVLALVNQASPSVLDFDVGLDRRAVDSILASRLLPHLPALSRLFYVGPEMMQRLHGFLGRVVPGDLCRTQLDCGTRMTCVGIPDDGSSSEGRCRDLTPIPGEGASCQGSAPCAPGLICVGSGTCAPGWMTDAISNASEVPIPASTPSPVVSSVVVQGQATVPVDLEVILDVSHPDMHALRIRLADPNGTLALLWDGPASPGRTFHPHIVVDNGISRDDAINGRWSLLIDNVTGTQAGLLKGWTLKVSSRWD